MARVATTQVDVLEAVISRLISQLTELKASNCYLSLEPYPDERITHPLCCIVSPMGGVYDATVFEGAGSNSLIENSGVIVSVWSNLKLDQSGHAERVLNDAARGLIVLKRKILMALTGHDLLDSDGNQILVALMAPRQAEHPQKGVMKDNLTGFSLMFSTDFEWDLSDA